MDNERKRTGTLVNFDLLPGLELTAQGNPVTAAQPIPYGVDHLIGFNELLTCGSTDGTGVHFYIDDYQFERFWRTPERYLRALLAFPLVVGPDFSLYTDYPEPLQRWNHYRNQMLTAWMQRQGVVCIQSASWTGPESFSWCFDGLSHGGAVAVSTVGCAKSREAQDSFLAGLEELIRRARPTELLIYGSIPQAMRELLQRQGIGWMVYPHGIAARTRAGKGAP